MSASPPDTAMFAHASMRPTPEGVGNVERRLSCRRNVDASMRPTPEGVGNDADDNPPLDNPKSFNEAHARRRGK